MTQITEPAIATESGGEDKSSGLFAALTVSEWGLPRKIEPKSSLHYPDAQALLPVQAREALRMVTQERDSLLSCVGDLTRRIDVLSGKMADMTRTWESIGLALSHDLPAPLRSIVGFSRLCQEEANVNLTPQAQAHLQRVIDAGTQMAHMLAALNQFLELGSVQLHLDRVNLGVLALSTIEEMRAREPSRRIEIAIGGSEHAVCLGDQRLLRTLLENVLGNAWKFTSRRPDARIDMSMIETPSGQTWQVRDNGVGFQMKHVAKLFRPFKRLHNHDDFPGMGMGLATARQIARRHGGDITAQSSLGLGANFLITVPNA